MKHTITEFTTTLKTTPITHWYQYLREYLEANNENIDFNLHTEIAQECKEFRINTYLSLGHSEYEAYWLAHYGHINR